MNPKILYSRKVKVVNMKWLNIPKNTRIKVNSKFKKLIYREKGDKNWKKFEKQIGISKWTLQNYLYGIRYRFKPDIKALKKIMENSSITAEELQNSIIWTDDLELLSLPEQKIEDVLISKKGKQFLDIQKLCKGLKSTGSNRVLFFPYKTKLLNNELIEVFYETGPGQFNTRRIKIPKMLELNKEIFLVFGLIQAEACKSLRKTSFDFSNSELIDVKTILDYFTSIWRIPKKKWVIYVTYWRPDFEEKKKMVEDFWKVNLGVKKVTVRKGTECRLSKKAKKYGVVSLRLDNKVFSNLVLNILNKIIKPLAETNSTYCGWYLTGLFEGDGTLSRHKGKFEFIGLAFNPKSDELDHYEKILNRIDIRFDKQHIKDVNRRCIFIQHWKNFLKILKVTNGELFLDKRKKIFIKGFLSNQYIKPLLRLKILKDKRPITTEIYSKIFNICKRGATENLKRLESLGLIEKAKKRRRGCFQFYISEEGNRFLNLINKLEMIGELDDNKATNSVSIGSCR